MSSSSENPWSNNPNAPQIPYHMYLFKKTDITSSFFVAIFYGITAILFFQCMGALLNPVDHKTRGIKWGLVALTTALFSALTVNAAFNLNFEPISNIDVQDLPSNYYSDLFPPGVGGYETILSNYSFNNVPNIMALVNPCLADGLLIYRCYVIYSMNYWVMVLPCLMYLATFVLGIATVYYLSLAVTDPFNLGLSTLGDLTMSFYSISLSLNILLTIMIITRLIFHRRNIRNAIGPATDSGLYSTVITMIFESFALYAVASLLFIGSYGASDYIQSVFAPILANIQVISPFLITLRVANRTALTSEAVSSGEIGSIHFRSRGESTAGNETLPGENLTSSMETKGEASGEPGAVVENIIEEVPI